MRRPTWIPKSLWLPLASFLAMSLISKLNVQTVSITVILYLALALLAYVIAVKIERRSIKTNYPYNIKILVYQTYDQISMIIFSFCFWKIGASLLEISAPFSNLSVSNLRTILNLSLLALLSITFYYSAVFARNRIEIIMATEKAPKTRPILSLLSAIPIIGVISGIFLSGINNHNNELTLLSILFLGIGYFILPIIFDAFFTNLLLVFYKWPTIEKLGNEYIVENS